MACPTPGGVPVSMIVPAGSVVPCDRNDTICGTLKIKSLFGRVSQQLPRFDPERLHLLESTVLDDSSIQYSPNMKF